MGIFSKIWKGIKKTVKKIGRGIKKVVKKVGRAIDKLGIVGQIGMMFLMPYAMSGLGSLFQGLNAAKVGSWAHTLAGGGKFAKTVSSVMNAVHTVGTTVMKPFTFIRDQIGEAVNWIGDTTGTSSLTDGVNKLIGYDPETRLKEFDLESIRSKYKSPLTKPSLPKSQIGGDIPNVSLGDATPAASTTPSGTIVDTGVSVVDQPSLLSKAGVDTLDFSLPKDFSLTETQNRFVPSFQDQIKLKFEAGTKHLTSLDNTQRQGWFAKQGESIVNAVKDFSVGEVVSSGIKRGGSERLAYAVAGDPPQQRILQTVREEPNLFALSNMFSDSTVFRSVNLASERQGNVWAGTNALNYDYIKSIGNDGTAEYYNNMRGLELMA